MEEQIKEMIKRERSYTSTNVTMVEPDDLAFEITSHVKQFHDWLVQDNTPNAFEKNYDYWLKNIKK